MKKIFLSLFFIFTAGVSYAGIGAEHDGSGNIVILRYTGNPGDFRCANCAYYSVSGSTDSVASQTYFRVNSLIQSVPKKYIKWTTEPVEMTQAEKNAVDAAEAQQIEDNLRSIAKDLYDGQKDQALALRSLVFVLLDEINILRTRITEIQDVIDGAGNLSDVKSGIGALSDLGNRTLSQAKTAIRNEIDSGTNIDE